MCAFRGRLLVGLGPVLRLYDLGKKKLLRKSENRSFPFRILSVSPPGNESSTASISDVDADDPMVNKNCHRVVVGDVQNSLLMVMYKKEDTSFYIVADDPIPRWLTCTLPLDYDTTVVGDKFGQLSVLRLDEKVSEALDADVSGARLTDKSHLLGAPNKVHFEKYHPTYSLKCGWLCCHCAICTKRA